MRTLGTYLPALACGAMMLLICVPMLFGRKHNSESDESDTKREIAELRDEVARLKAERSADREAVDV